jgi:signal transduction histidine kinase
MEPAPTTPLDAPDLAALGAVSLERRLPLVMTGVLAAGLATLLGVTYTVLVRRAEDLVREKLRRAVAEVAASARTAMVERADGLRELARHPAMELALTGRDAAADRTSARLALAEMRDARDSLIPAELWDVRGRVVAFTGPPLAGVRRPAPSTPLPPREAARATAADTVIFTPLEVDGARARFWGVAPVRVAGAVVGYVAAPRHVSGRPDVVRTLSELTGEAVNVHTRNADGSVWVEGPGTVVPPPTRRDSTRAGIHMERRGVGRVLAADAVIGGTPLVVTLETPESAVLAGPRRTLARLTLLALGVVAAGAVASWIIGRRITRPLTRLTGAAENLALGTYEHPIVVGRQDEVGRLSASFDAMARQVVAARTELERRAEDAQAAAAALTRTNAQLREAMKEAEHARAEADRANRAKSDFLAMMSHELRTPLNAIGGYAELLEMGIHGPVTEAQREALLRIGRSQAHLLTLITDVLDFARIDAGQVRFAMEDVPLHEALAGLEALIAPQLRTRGLSYTYHPCDPALTARADGDKLRQLVLNLLGNAVKYTPDGGAIALSCIPIGERVAVRVQDNGAGIPAERQALIFEPFVQGERALNRPTEGVGLGLAISRELAQGMGGTLAVESEVGRGSVFTLTLERSGVAAPATTLVARPSAASLA